MSATGRTDPPARAAEVERAAAAWLARRDAPAWSAADNAALEAWLAADTAHRVAYLRLYAAWQESGRLRALGAGWHQAGPPPRGFGLPGHSRADALAAAAARPRATPAPARRARRAWSVAAAVASLAVAAWIGWTTTGLQTAAYRSAAGTVDRVPLADGSRAVLAGGSRIDVRLSRGERHVALREGEAIFEVAKDPARPFVVEAAGGRAVAVGTRFSVRRDADGLRVIVTEGRVRLEPAPAGAARPTVMLPAGSIATVGPGGVLVRSVSPAQADRALGWQSGQLVFHDAPLADAAADFARCNARRIAIDDAATAALRIGGSFRCDNVEGFARLLEQAFPVRAQVQPDRIALRAR